MQPSKLAAGLVRGFGAAEPAKARPADVLTKLLEIDAELDHAGAPPMSGYWIAEVARFYRHPSAKLLVECVGRGGDKSRTSTKMAIAEVLAGQFSIPPGERHYFTHVAENRDEASKTLGVLEQYLRLLSVPFERSGDTIELERLPRGFKVLACRVGAVSGWRCIGWTADECAKWSSEGADPSAEVIASMRAMTVTHPGARGRMFSSPLGCVGYFYDTWRQGPTDEQLCGHAPSWVANPIITEQQTHELEPNERKRKREYGAIPTQETDSAMFSAAMLDKCTREQGDLPRESGVTYVAYMDPGLTRNAWTLCVAGQRWVGAKLKRSIVCVREWKGSHDKPLDPEIVLREIAATLADYEIRTVWSDTYDWANITKVGQRVGLTVAIEACNATERLRRYESLVMAMADGQIDLHPDRQLRLDLLAVEQKLTLSGFTIYLPETPDGRHTDYAPSAVGALSRATTAPLQAVPPRGTAEYNAAEEERMLQAAKQKFIPSKGRAGRDQWWQHGAFNRGRKEAWRGGLG